MATSLASRPLSTASSSFSSNASQPLQHHATSQRTPSVTRTSSSPLIPAGLRVPSNKKTIYDRNINRTRTAESSRASFAYLFGEMISYAQARVTGIQDLERRLNEQGYPLGLRLSSLLLLRSTSSSSSSSSASSFTSSLSSSASLPARPTKILPLLQFLSQTVWRHLFARPASAIESSATNPNEYMISDNEPLVSSYISVPKEMSQLNCGAFVAGIIEGICCGVLDEGKVFLLNDDGTIPREAAKLDPPAVVSAHNAPDEGGMWPGKTVYLIKFSAEVVARENAK